jgi:hypothetical protein
MRLLRVFLAAGVLELIAAPVAGAEIVYMKGPFDQTGSTLWAMNDAGSGSHQLLSSSQVSPNDRLGYPSLLPNGTTLAFEGITDEYANLNGPLATTALTMAASTRWRTARRRGSATPRSRQRTLAARTRRRR